jgi:hypothetical protein
MNTRIMLVCAGLGLIAGRCPAQFATPASVLGSGGGIVACAAFRISGTIGQTFIGRVNDAFGAQDLGFWYEPRVVVTSVETPGSTPSSIRITAMYPGPAHHRLVVEYAGAGSYPADFALYDPLGRRVFERREQGPGSDGSVILALDPLPRGCYVLRVSAGGASTARMVAIE